MKKALTILGVVVVVVAGAWLLSRHPADEYNLANPSVTVSTGTEFDAELNAQVRELNAADAAAASQLNAIELQP